MTYITQVFIPAVAFGTDWTVPEHSDSVDTFHFYQDKFINPSWVLSKL